MSVCPAFWRRAAAWSGGACADGSRPARRWATDSRSVAAVDRVASSVMDSSTAAGSGWGSEGLSLLMGNGLQQKRDGKQHTPEETGARGREA